MCNLLYIYLFFISVCIYIYLYIFCVSTYICIHTYTVQECAVDMELQLVLIRSEKSRNCVPEQMISVQLSLLRLAWMLCWQLCRKEKEVAAEKKNQMMKAIITEGSSLFLSNTQLDKGKILNIQIFDISAKTTESSLIKQVRFCACT